MALRLVRRDARRDIAHPVRRQDDARARVNQDPEHTYCNPKVGASRDSLCEASRRHGRSFAQYLRELNAA